MTREDEKMAFKLKDWVKVPWSEVEQDEIVRTADERQWRVKGAWNGSRVLLHPLLPGDGVPVSPALTDGTKQVEVLRHRPRPNELDGQSLAKFGAPAKPQTAAFHAAVAEHRIGIVRRLVEKDGEEPWCTGCGRYQAGCVCQPMTAAEQAQQLAPADPMTPGMPDPCQPIGCDNGIHRPGCTFAELPPVAPPAGSDVQVVTELGDVRPKFGQPASDLTAAEQRSTDPADDEGRAVAEMARHGLAPELVSVEEGGKILVPRELDDLALRSHLFLMHGHLDTEQDVDRAKLSEVHGRLHESECPHQHVNRSELPS